jgi:aminoglycoside phosphotransferase (APT) family kinase protein
VATSAALGFTIDGSLEAWLATTVGLVPTLRGEQIAGGWSNVTAVVRAGDGRAVVVRQPPAGRAHGGAHDVLREARIMTALGGTPVPVPRVPVPRVLGQAAGERPVYAMELVDGVVVDSAGRLDGLDTAARTSLAGGLLDVLVALQRVDVEQAGLGDLRRSTPYLERQLRRWSGQWDRTATRSVPELERAAGRLRAGAPAVAPVPECLVHGDFRLGNVMVAPADHSRVVALLDWELCTVGHPLADLGFLGARTSAPAEVLPEGRDPLAADGMPPFDALVAMYAERAGTPVDPADVAYFVALSAWRWAIIVEGIGRRFAEGAMGAVTEDVQWQRMRVGRLAALANEWLDLVS